MLPSFQMPLMALLGLALAFCETAAFGVAWCRATRLELIILEEPERPAATAHSTCRRISHHTHFQ